MENCKIALLISFVVLHLSPVPFANAQEFSLGRCPRFPTVTNFEAQRVHQLLIVDYRYFVLLRILKLTNFYNLTPIIFFQYLGLWYEYSNYFAIFQAFQDCVTAFYTDETPSSSYSGVTPALKIGVLNRGRNVL